jgi:hypothetical protein
MEPSDEIRAILRILNYCVVALGALYVLYFLAEVGFLLTRYPSR